MPDLFSSIPGQVLVISGVQASALVNIRQPSIKLANESSGQSLKNVSQQIIITGVSVKSAVNMQFMPTLGADIYAFSFGDRPSQVSLSGICFWTSCSGSSTGVSSLFNYYEANRANIANQMPLMDLFIDVNRPPFRGFLMGMDFQAMDAAIPLGRFSFNFITLPTRAPAGQGVNS